MGEGTVLLGGVGAAKEGVSVHLSDSALRNQINLSATSKVCVNLCGQCVRLNLSKAKPKG